MSRYDFIRFGGFVNWADEDTDTFRKMKVCLPVKEPVEDDTKIGLISTDEDNPEEIAVSYSVRAAELIPWTDSFQEGYWKALIVAEANGAGTDVLLPMLKDAGLCLMECVFLMLRSDACKLFPVLCRLFPEVEEMFENLLAELNYKRFMFKKLCILLIFSKLNEIKHLIDKYRMHNLYAIFAKLLNICKQIAGNLVNESGNVPRRGVVPKFSDLEVVALNMASEAVGIDSESLLFANLQEYRVEIPNLISRRQYNDRRKITSSLCNAIRERMVAKMDGGEDYFCIDSKPIEVCRIARSKRCSMGKKDFRKAPGVGYCASQSMYYYGYKLHAVCWLSGIIHSFDLTKASVHDIHYLKDVKVDYSNCTVIGDRGYISAQVQLDLFETANIRLEVPYRCNQKEWKPTFPAFAKARKRIETLFSQLCDQFMIIRNYAKDTDGLFARIIGKISALTILQYINYKNEKPIGRVKYALF